MIRRLVALVALAGAACHPLATCKPGTLFVDVDYSGRALSADTVVVRIAIDGGSAVATTLHHSAGASSGSIEVDFPKGYPAGHVATVEMDALVGTLLVASVQVRQTLIAGCQPLTLALTGATGDLAGGVVVDGGGVKTLGELCGVGGECASGSCADGVCCDAPCGGQCEACNTAGHCGAVTGMPTGTRAPCTDDGSGCGGVCDGTLRATCSYPVMQCRAASCSAGVVTSPAACDNGTCPTKMTQTCPSGICSPSGCLTATEVSAGGSFSCAAISDGTVRCWGDNTNGQLGFDPNVVSSKHTPTTVPGLTGVAHIASGGSTTCALLVDHTLRCWGGTALGRGDGDTSPAYMPEPVVMSVGGPQLANIGQVTVGSLHACAIQGAGGGTYCWGNDGSGRLGNGLGTGGSNAPTLVCASGSACATGVSYSSVAAGLDQTCAFSTGGGALCWGNNGYGQLGITQDANAHPNPVAVGVISNIVVVGAGDEVSCAGEMFGQDTLYCWGNLTYGMVGCARNGGYADSPQPVCTKSDCSAYLGGVTQIAIGGDHTCVVVGGGVRCWGFGPNGQLGDGTKTQIQNYSATSVMLTGTVDNAASGVSHTCAHLTNGTVWCWGADDSYQLGDNDSADKPTPVTPAW